MPLGFVLAIGGTAITATVAFISERAERITAAAVTEKRLTRLELRDEQASESLGEIRRRAESTQVIQVLMQEDVKWLVQEARRGNDKRK